MVIIKSKVIFSSGGNSFAFGSEKPRKYLLTTREKEGLKKILASDDATIEFWENPDG